MRKRLKSQHDNNFVPATYQGPWPGDFPIGSVQSRAAARAILNAHAEELRKEEDINLAKLNPSGQAMIEDVDDPGVRKWIILLLLAAQESEKAYGMPLPWPTPEKIRHNRAVFKEVNRMTGGRASSIHMNNSIEWNRLRAVAEENLRGKKK
jgi:hypothetical protein